MQFNTSLITLNLYSMKSLRNSVQLIGNLGNDPEVRTLESGKALATFSLATSEHYYNKAGEKVQDTQWHNIIAWGRKAEIVERLLKKGSEVAIEGKLVHRSFETQKGERKYITEINLNELALMSRQSA